MKEYSVIVPEDQFTIINFIQDNLPGVAAINTALKNFEPKIVFAWHLSFMIDLEDLIENGMPSKTERGIIDPFGDNLDLEIKGPDFEKPNALFLGRITWNKTRELIWRVYDPKSVDNFLKKVIDDNGCQRSFDYKMEYDPDWTMTAWHLGNHEKK